MDEQEVHEFIEQAVNHFNSCDDNERIERYVEVLLSGDGTMIRAGDKEYRLELTEVVAGTIKQLEDEMFD